MDWKRVKNELTQGKSHAYELKKELLKYLKSSSSCEASDFHLEKVIDSLDNAIAHINDVITVSSSLESPNSAEDQGFKDRGGRVSKKRKIQAGKWREQVSVCSETGFDGYNWRKYGQKKILKANHPRAYYRCTHRHTQGCLATKQVQKEDENPSNFTVVYVGKHTCVQETLKQNIQDLDYSKNEEIDEEIKADKEYSRFPSFSFHVTPPPTPPPAEDDGGFFLGANNYSSPPLETSESYFSTSHCQQQLNNDGDFAVGLIQGSPSDFADIVSNPTEAATAEEEEEEVFVFGDIDTRFLDASDSFW